MQGCISKEAKKFISVYCASGFTQYKPYVIGYGATGPINSAPATSAIDQFVGVPQGATTTVPGFYPFLVEGVGMATCDGTGDIASGGFLELLNTGTALVFDHDTVRTVGAVACNESGAAITSATPAAYKVRLLGLAVNIAGS